MTYEFIAEDGSVIEENHPMKTAPDEIVREGKRYKRAAFSRANKVFFNDAQVKTMVEGYPRDDVTMPRGEDVGGGLTPKGRPIIRSRTHEKEVQARYGYRRD